MKECVIEFKEFDELRKQFGLLEDKLDKQRIISEEIVNETIKEKLSHVEKWYRNRFCTSIIWSPIISALFFFMYIDKGAEYWAFSLFILAVGVLEYLLNRRCFKALDVDRLPSMSMTDALERVVEHKRLRSLTEKIMILKPRNKAYFSQAPWVLVFFVP